MTYTYINGTPSSPETLTKVVRRQDLRVQTGVARRVSGTPYPCDPMGAEKHYLGGELPVEISPEMARKRQIKAERRTRYILSLAERKPQPIKEVKPSPRVGIISGVGSFRETYYPTVRRGRAVTFLHPIVNTVGAAGSQENTEGGDIMGMFNMPDRVEAISMVYNATTMEVKKENIYIMDRPLTKWLKLNGGHKAIVFSVKNMSIVDMWQDKEGNGRLFACLQDAFDRGVDRDGKKAVDEGFMGLALVSNGKAIIGAGIEVGKAFLKAMKLNGPTIDKKKPETIKAWYEWLSGYESKFKAMNTESMRINFDPQVKGFVVQGLKEEVVYQKGLDLVGTGHFLDENSGGTGYFRGDAAWTRLFVSDKDKVKVTGEWEANGVGKIKGMAVLCDTDEKWQRACRFFGVDPKDVPADIKWIGTKEHFKKGTPGTVVDVTCTGVHSEGSGLRKVAAVTKQSVHSDSKTYLRFVAKRLNDLCEIVEAVNNGDGKALTKLGDYRGMDAELTGGDLFDEVFVKYNTSNNGKYVGDATATGLLINAGIDPTAYFMINNIMTMFKNVGMRNMVDKGKFFDAIHSKTVPCNLHTQYLTDGYGRKLQVAIVVNDEMAGHYCLLFGYPTTNNDCITMVYVVSRQEMYTMDQNCPPISEGAIAVPTGLWAKAMRDHDGDRGALIKAYSFICEANGLKKGDIPAASAIVDLALEFSTTNDFKIHVKDNEAVAWSGKRFVDHYDAIIAPTANKGTIGLGTNSTSKNCMDAHVMNISVHSPSTVKRGWKKVQVDMLSEASMLLQKSIDSAKGGKSWDLAKQIGALSPIKNHLYNILAADCKSANEETRVVAGQCVALNGIEDELSRVAHWFVTLFSNGLINGKNAKDFFKKLTPPSVDEVVVRYMALKSPEMKAIWDAGCRLGKALKKYNAFVDCDHILWGTNDFVKHVGERMKEVMTYTQKVWYMTPENDKPVGAGIVYFAEPESGVRTLYGKVPKFVKEGDYIKFNPMRFVFKTVIEIEDIRSKAVAGYMEDCREKNVETDPIFFTDVIDEWKNQFFSLELEGDNLVSALVFAQCYVWSRLRKSLLPTAMAIQLGVKEAFIKRLGEFLKTELQLEEEVVITEEDVKEESDFGEEFFS